MRLLPGLTGKHTRPYLQWPLRGVRGREKADIGRRKVRERIGKGKEWNGKGLKRRGVRKEGRK